MVPFDATAVLVPVISVVVGRPWGRGAQSAADDAAGRDLSLSCARHQTVA